MQAKAKANIIDQENLFAEVQTEVVFLRRLVKELFESNAKDVLHSQGVTQFRLTELPYAQLMHTGDDILQCYAARDLMISSDISFLTILWSGDQGKAPFFSGELPDEYQEKYKHQIQKTETLVSRLRRLYEMTTDEISEKFLIGKPLEVKQVDSIINDGDQHYMVECDGVRFYTGSVDEISSYITAYRIAVVMACKNI